MTSEDRRRTALVVALVALAAVAAPAIAAGGSAASAMPIAGDRALGAGDRALGAGDRALGAGDRALGAGDRALGAGDRALGAGDGDTTVERRANGLALFSLDPAVLEAAPGEQATVAVVLRSSPQIASGAYKAGFVLEFNASVLRATNVSEGPFMERRRNTTVRVNQSAVDNQRGFVLYELVRDPPNGGVSGAAAFAYVTFEVREDAPDGSYPIGFFRTLVLLTDGNFQQVSTRSGEFVVNGSAAADTPTPTPAAGTPTATPTATATRTVAVGETPGGGPGAVVGVVALLGTIALLAGVLVLVRRA